MLGKKFLKSVAKKAINVGEDISQEAYDAAKSVGKNTVKVGEKLEEAASQAVGAVTDNLSGNESTGWDIAKLPEEQRLVFYGALFAIASANGHFDKDEWT